MEYLFFVFVEHKKQDKLVQEIAKELLTLSDLSKVSYYYGEQSMIFSFKTSHEFCDLKEWFNVNFVGVVYFLVPHETDKMSYFLSEDVKLHLFGDVKMTKKQENEIEEQDLYLKYFTNMVDEDDDDDDDDQMLKPKEKEPRLDDILDKINEKGIDSLTTKELTILKKYSNN